MSERQIAATRLANTKHGMRGTREYHSWQAMKHRCCNKNDPYYHRYGGRGITVCSEWIDSFERFFADMGPRPAGKTLDRKDGSCGYSKENCRWATSQEQQRNRSSNRRIAIAGEVRTLIAWCEAYGINSRTVASRLFQGWNEVLAVTTPARTYTNTRKARACRLK